MVSITSVLYTIIVQIVFLNKYMDIIVLDLQIMTQNNSLIL